MLLSSILVHMRGAHLAHLHTHTHTPLRAPRTLSGPITEAVPSEQVEIIPGSSLHGVIFRDVSLKWPEGPSGGVVSSEWRRYIDLSTSVGRLYGHLQ